MDISGSLKKLLQTGNKCLFCSKELLQKNNDEKICSNCIEAQGTLKNKDFKSPYYVYSYEGIIRKLIHAYKYDDKARLAFFIAQEMFEMIKKHNIEYDIITYVPVHKTRLRQRGFDQSENIALFFSTLANIPCYKLLKRIRATKPQYKLSRDQRMENVENAFEFCDANINVTNKKVLLIDDIYTTGATAIQCESVLFSQGAKVIIYTFAREH